MGTGAEELLAAGILGVGRLGGGGWRALWGIGVTGMVGLSVSVGWKGGGGPGGVGGQSGGWVWQGGGEGEICHHDDIQKSGKT